MANNIVNFTCPIDIFVIIAQSLGKNFISEIIDSAYKTKGELISHQLVDKVRLGML